MSGVKVWSVAPLLEVMNDFYTKVTFEVTGPRHDTLGRYSRSVVNSDKVFYTSILTNPHPSGQLRFLLYYNFKRNEWGPPFTRDETVKIFNVKK